MLLLLRYCSRAPILQNVLGVSQWKMEQCGAVIFNCVNQTWLGAWSCFRWNITGGILILTKTIMSSLANFNLAWPKFQEKLVKLTIIA